jgi:hypothetical protein
VVPEDLAAKHYHVFERLEGVRDDEALVEPVFAIPRVALSLLWWKS